MKTLLEELRSESNNDKLELLTIEKAIELKGKRIQTIYFGYNGQDGVNDFIVGEIVPHHTIIGNQDEEFQKKAKEKYKYDFDLLTIKNKETYIRVNTMPSNPNKSTFYCSDSDRLVSYRIVE